MSLRERCRIELVVQRLGWWLDWKRMPGRRRRVVLREVRANLHDAAAAGDLDTAIERLGPARVLAEAYLEGEPAEIRWRAGWIAALVAYTLVLWLGFAAAVGFAEGVQAVGPQAGAVYETGHSLTLGAGPLLSFEQTEHGLTFHLSFLGWPHLAAAAAAFVAFSRPWRAATSRRGNSEMLTMRESRAAARHARRLAFLLLAAVTVACGSVIWSGGWTALTTVSAAVAAGTLAGFVPALLLAMRQRGATLNR